MVPRISILHRVLLRVCACLMLLFANEVNGAESYIAATVDHTMIDEDLVDFPVMLLLDETNAQDFFDRIVSNPVYSLKFRVEDSLGSQCYVEKELWVYTNRTVVLHVQIPLVSSATDTVIKLFYDETMADNDTYVGDTGTEAAQNVWDSNFDFVYHMADNPTGQVKNSTSSGYNLWSVGNMTEDDLVDSIAGKSIDFDGSDDGLKMTTGPVTLNRSEFSVEVLFKPSALPGSGYYAHMVTTESQRAYGGLISRINNNVFEISAHIGGARDSTQVSGALVIDSWYYGAGQWKSGEALNAWLNGQKTAGATYGGNLSRGGGTWNFGNWIDVRNREFQGQLDEIRLSSVKRTDAWLKATYHTLFDTLIEYSQVLDTDRDEIADDDEINSYGTDPNLADTDGDGIDDGEELNYWGSAWAQDPDGDNLINLLDSDSDNDGVSDGGEIYRGYDPADPGSTPPSGAAFKDVDYGFDTDEQQGGGGLVGETIRILNGNSLVRRSDLSFPSPHSMGLAFQTVYNNQLDKAGNSGFGWTHSYEAYCDPSFIIDGQTYIRIVDQTGRMHYFTEDTPGVYKGEFKELTHVKAESGDFVWYLLDGSRYGFSGAGRLIWIDDEKGNRLSLAYDAYSRLESVADNAGGRTFTFHYDGSFLDHISGPVTPAVSDGIWVTYGYDANQNLTSVTYADGSGFTFVYSDVNDSHNLTEMRNKADHLLGTWSYDNEDRCTDNFSSDGNGAAINYASPTQVNVTDAYGTVRTYTVSEITGRKRVMAMQGPVGAPYNDSNIVSWQYDSGMNLTEVETAGNAVHQYQNHDSRGNRQIIILASGTAEQRTISYTYHPEMNVPLTRTEASILGAGNKVTTWDYDDDYNTTANEDPTNLISRIIEQGYTKDASGATVSFEYITTFTYNSKGQVLSIDGPRAGTADTTTFAYEGSTGNLHSVTQPLIGITNFSSYDAAGQPGQVTDVNGQSDTFEYDGRSRIIEITHQADSSTKTVAYTVAGLPEIVTDEDGIYYAFEYDATYGRLVRKNDMDGNYIAYAYDSQGNLIEHSKHNSADEMFSRKRWDYQHPAIPGKLWKEIKYDNSFAEYGYNSDGNVNYVADFNLNTTTYEHNSLNRLITVTQPGSVIISYDFDLHGNLISVMDAENHETTFTHDDMGRVVSTTSPDTGTTAYVYDAAGNLERKTDAKVITVQYSYDLLNRLTAVQFPDSAQNIGYSYDAGTYGKGHRTGMTDPAGSTTFGYDSRGRFTGKTTIVNAIQYPISGAFTPGSRLTSLVYPTGRTVDFTRYDNGKIRNLSTTYNSTTVDLFSNMTYDPFSRPSGMDTGTGSSVNNQSGACNCLEKINPGQMMEQIYTYDGNGNITDINATNVSWLSQSFVYDALNRLESATGLYGTTGYTYDKVGNRLTRASGGQTDTYSYVSGTNRLDQISGPNATDFDYDLNGNITAIDLKTLIYNQNNRLVRVQEGANVLGEYTYNGLGQRVVKDADGAETVFLYDFDGNIIAESTISGTMKTEYLYMGSNRLAMVDVSSGNLYYFNNNYLGTPLLMTDSSGNVVWDADYKPFGDTDVNPNSEVVNNFRFAGQYYDEETELHYNYYRYYDPKTGRYLRADPIGLYGGINLYSYASNNPINRIDPLGLDTWSGAGDEFGGFLGFGGISTMYSFVINWETGEKCYLETRCYKIGVGIAGGVTANSVWILNGPKLGKDLAGVTVGAGAEGGLGGYLSGSPTGAVGVSADSSAGITGGAGLGAGLAMYASHCTTRVISCTNTPNCE